MTVQYTIRDLAAEFGVTPRAIRFYEEKGLLSPVRDGQHRLFSPADRTRLRLILRGKRLGLSLEESAGIIGMYDAGGGNRKQLETLVGTIREKRHELQARRAELDAMLEEMDQAERKCAEALARLERTST